MNRLVLTAIMFIIFAGTPAFGTQTIFDTGTPPVGPGSVSCDISSYHHIAIAVSLQDSDYRVEYASAFLGGRSLFVLNILEVPSTDFFPDRGVLVSTGSFKQPEPWDGQPGWCPVDVADFTMKKAMTYWFEYTSSNYEVGTEWLQAKIQPSVNRRAYYNGSSWEWPSVISRPDYAPGLRLYGSAVPEPSCLIVLVGGLVGLIAGRRSRSR